MAARLLLVWHSRTGRTTRLKDAVVAGVRRVQPALDLRVLAAANAQAADLLWGDGYLFGCAEHFGAMAGLFKDFLERCYVPVQGQVDARPYALFIACHNDGRGAVAGIDKVLRGLQLKSVQAPVIWRETESGVDGIGAADELGETFATGLGMGLW